MDVKGRFDEAIRLGLRNALLERNVVYRVNQLLGELSQALQNITDGQVSVGLSGWSLGKSNQFAGASICLSAQKKINRYKLVVYREDSLWESAEVLAEWSLVDLSWPCTIQSPGFMRVCDDIEELKIALKELVSLPHAGRAIKKVIDFQPSAFFGHE